MKAIHLKSQFRTMHTQVCGTTHAGKTASFMLPAIANDIKKGRGMIIIDGKSDRSFLEQIYAHAVQAGRKEDFRVFSLAQPHISFTFNPFAQGTAEQITERVFSAFSFTDEYYRAVQFGALRTLTALLMHQGKVPQPGVIRALLRDRKALESQLNVLATEGSDPNLKDDLAALMAEKSDDAEKKYSGLVTALGHFSQGQTAPLFNTESPEIILSDVMKSRKIVYFQLPTMQYPFLGAATGRLVLQCLQSAISQIQVEGVVLENLFSVYLDDFNDYIYPEFISLLNKSRSAGVGVVFAHQSLGDLKKVSDNFTQQLMANTNTKIIMRSPDPESAEYFAKLIGTRTAEKTTERRSAFLPGLPKDTGEQSVRQVEEYIVHPNTFKFGLAIGEGFLLAPNAEGRIVKRIRFSMLPKLPPISLPSRVHTTAQYSTQAYVTPPSNAPKEPLKGAEPTHDASRAHEKS